MKLRPVHYAAHGSGGLAFRCYHRDLRAHLDSGTTVPAVKRPGHFSAPTRKYGRPTPLRHTDLSKVTCRECWAAIRKMALRWVGPAGG